MSESAPVFSYVAAERTCDGCGKSTAMIAWHFDFTATTSEGQKQIGKSFGPYPAKPYNFCMECILRAVGVKP